jgi:hypothetical protein
LCSECSDFLHRKKKDHLEKLQKSKWIEPILCEIHSCEIQSLCLDCNIFICIKCLGKGGSHNDHDYKLISEANEEIEILHKELLKNSSQTLESLENEFEYFKKEKDDLSKFFESILRLENEKLKKLGANIDFIKEIPNSTFIDPILSCIKLSSLEENNFDIEKRKNLIDQLKKQFEIEFKSPCSKKSPLVWLNRSKDGYLTSTSWSFSNSVDAIEFTSNIPFYFKGVSFGIGMNEKYNGVFQLLEKNSEKILLEKDLNSVVISPSEPFTLIEFKNSILLKKDTFYIIQAKMTKKDAKSGVCAKNMCYTLKHENLEIKFSASKNDTNGTSVGEGQFNDFLIALQ